MNNHNCLGTGCNLAGDQHGVDVPSVAPAIDDDRNSTRAHDSRGTGDDCKARENDLIARTDAQGRERHFDRHAAVTHSNAMGAAHQFGESSFEFFDERTFRGDPARLDAFGEILLLVPIKKRPVDRYHEVLIEIKLFRQYCSKLSFVTVTGVRTLLYLHHIEFLKDLETVASGNQQDHISRTK